MDVIQNEHSNYLIIDGSYYCFYRYYAIHAWWKNAVMKSDEYTEEEKNIDENL